MKKIIEVKNICQTFDSTVGFIKKKKIFVKALDNVSFNISSGQIFGLLGENGAGKTTMIKILATLLIPSSGEAKVLGYDVVKDYKKIRPQINFIFGGERGLYWRLTGRENLQYFMDLYHVPFKNQATLLDKLLNLVDLIEAQDRKVETYSKGMKQRLQIARGLVNNPKVIFLDEPTIGLDPVATNNIRDIVLKLKQQGTTILLTTHYMNEAEELCDEIGILKKGHLLKIGNIEKIKESSTDAKIILAEALFFEEATIKKLKSLQDIKNVSIENKEKKQVLKVAYQNENTKNAIVDILNSQKILSLMFNTSSLEAAYLKIMQDESAR